jgi:hypothetical protein
MSSPDALDQALNILGDEGLIGSGVGPIHIQEMSDSELALVVAQLEALPKFVEIVFTGAADESD